MFFNKKYRILKKMRFVADQQGIIRRYLKESENWALHLERCKQIIKKATEGQKGGNCAVLGSGWLLDIPIETLTERFDKVYLFDIIHPSQIKHKYHNNPKVELIEHDITGGVINQLYEVVQYYKTTKQNKLVEDFTYEGFQFDVDFDFVISANILSQLGTLLLEYIGPYNIYSAEDLVLFEKNIEQSHVNSLPKGKSCLITDYIEFVYSKDNVLERQRNLLQIEFEESQISESWQWKFDHLDYYKDKDIVYHVVALNI